MKSRMGREKKKCPSLTGWALLLFPAKGQNKQSAMLRSFQREKGEIFIFILFFFFLLKKKNGRECWTEPNKEMKGLSWPHRYGELPDSAVVVVVVGADLLQAQKQLLMSHLTC